MGRGAGEFEEAAVGADSHVQGIAGVLVHGNTGIEEHFCQHFRRGGIFVLKVEIVGVMLVGPMMIDTEAVHIREIKISAAFQISQIRKHQGVIVLSLRHFRMHQGSRFDKAVHMGHRVRQQHIRFLSQLNQHVVESTDGTYIISIGMLVAYQKETVMGHEEIPGFLLADFLCMIQGKAHLFSSL